MTLARFLSLPAENVRDDSETPTAWLPMDSGKSTNNGVSDNDAGSVVVGDDIFRTKTPVSYPDDKGGCGGGANTSTAADDPLLFSLRLRPAACLRSFEEFSFLPPSDSASVTSSNPDSPPLTTLPAAFTFAAGSRRNFARTPLPMLASRNSSTSSLTTSGSGLRLFKHALP